LAIRSIRNSIRTPPMSTHNPKTQSEPYTKRAMIPTLRSASLAKNGAPNARKHQPGVRPALPTEGGRNHASKSALATEGGRNHASKNALPAEGGRNHASKNALATEGGRNHASKNAFPTEGGRSHASENASR